MSDPVLPPPSDETPIDAEFEPAPKRAPKPAKKRGPGWFSFLLLGAVSIGALGLSLLSNTALLGQNQNDSFAADIERLKVDIEAASEARIALRSDTDRALASTEALRAETTTIQTRITDVSDALSLIETDLQTMAMQEAVETAPAETTGLPTSLIDRIDAIEAQLSESNETSTVATSTDTPTTFDPTDLETEVASLRSDVDRLRDELTTLRGDLSGLIEAQQTASIEETETASSADAAMALSAIETSARRGQPFQAAYRALTEADDSLPGLAALQPIAATGAPTLPDLREAFRPLKRAALKADAETKGATQSVLNSLFGDGIRVRREGEVSAADVLETAENALVTGDLDAALTAIDTLSPEIQSVFTDWRDDAEKRLNLEDSLDTLRLAMIAKDRP